MKKQMLLPIVLLLVVAILPATAEDCISKYGKHNLDVVESKSPTCTEDGYEILVCTNEGCNYRETETFMKYGHSYADGVCTRCQAQEPTLTSSPEPTFPADPDPTSGPTLSPEPTFPTDPDPTSGPTLSPEPTSTVTADPTPALTSSPEPTPAAVPDPTPGPTPTSTVLPTGTPVPFIPSLPPTGTPLPPTETAKPDPTPVLTPISTVPPTGTPVPFIPSLPPADTPLPPAETPMLTPTAAPTEIPIPPLDETTPSPTPEQTQETLPPETPSPTPTRSSNGSKANTARKKETWDLEIAFPLTAAGENVLFLTKKTGSPSPSGDPDDPYQYEATLFYVSNIGEPVPLLKGRCWFSAAVRGEAEEGNAFRLTVIRLPQLTVTFESPSVSVSFLPDPDQDIFLLLRVLGLEDTGSPFMTVELSGTSYAP